MIRLKRCIVLVGLMGAGKTSVGRRLADLLKVRFHDTDDAVEEASSMSIPELFESFGEPEFRRLEAAVLGRLLEQAPAVISTGGGAFMQPVVRSLVATQAVSVWLKADVEVLWARVRDKPGRPLLQTDDPFATLLALHEARAPTYATADVTVGSTGVDSQDDVAKAVIRAIGAFDAEAQSPSFERR